MTPPARPGRGGAEPLSARAVALVGAGLLSLLLVAAVASRAGSPAGGGGSERTAAPTFVADFVVTFFLVGILPGGAIVLVYALWLRRMAKRAYRSPARSMVGTVVIAAAASLAAVLVATGLQHWRNDSAKPKGIPSGVAGDGKTRLQAYRPGFSWYAAAVTLALVVAVLANAAILVAKRRREEPDAEDAELAATLARVLDDTLDDLRRETDPRRAVIAAYARMEATLGAYGLPRDPAEAPLEYLARVLRELRVRAAAALDLTTLFERAKFSTHEIDPAMKEEAIAALITVREELRAPA
jgi:hypothetical protein